MKNLLIIVFALLLFACGSGSSTTEENKEEGVNGNSEAVENASEEFSLSENNHYQSLFNELACEKLSDTQVASLLDIPADQIKKSNSLDGYVRCGWGYYPEDRKAGKNISVKLYEDEYTTEQHFKGDIKQIQEGKWITQVDLDIPHVVLATYRQDRGWLKVYISKKRMMEFQIGPTMQSSEEEQENLKSIAIIFAEAFITN